MVAIIVLLGYTAVGTPIILMMDLAKGYVIGFTFSLIVSMLGSKGCYVSLIRINASEFNFYSNNNVNQRFGYKTFSYKIKNGSI